MGVFCGYLCSLKMVKDSAYIANITKGEWINELKYLYGFRVLRLCICNFFLASIKSESSHCGSKI